MPCRLAWALMIAAGALSACAAGGDGAGEPAPAPYAAFDWFRYEGTEAEGAPEPAADEYRNPVIAGFYPDPSVVQVGADYYLVNSTFAWFPGVPVFHSRDLVGWRQIANAIDRPGMVDFTGLGVSRGIFAATIEHHEGKYYIATTCVDCGDNFIITADDPAGPWSEPIWLPEVGGIDPSLFFDEDGAVYLLNNDAPPGEARYDGHRAIWIRRIDPETLQPLTKPRVLIDGGVRPEENPIWIEGPHLYKIGGWYYLIAAEGGTAIGHSQVALRAREIFGPYEPYDGNPILTQRDLPENRENPVTSVGHADLVQDAKGGWHAAFLGVRPYEGDYYNTGRETFLLPVEWREGWPIILPPGEPVPMVVKRPPSEDAPTGAASADDAPAPTTGPFSVYESFDAPALAPYWLSLRGPAAPWLRLENGAAKLYAQADGLGDFGRPAFLARRQQHLFALAETEVSLARAGGAEAGLAAFQNDEFYYALGAVRDGDGKTVVRLRRRAGPETPPAGEVIASAALAGAEAIRLRIRARGALYDFEYAGADGEWRMLLAGADGRILSTREAGGFVGAVLGLYAQYSARP
ncbi:glycoside hydrolase family 43 protein [Amphiplicatus metriothermophilus]|uniref:Alpha-N-arabinofuranosidase n=1 Tax=Amphiplicatus metriothermophilus TaxID=1519374 RepID=A0A239PWB5_9PROT|nr:glycoside hydrolase family 43 protein [Amphiplicatus metriothermophilus]MBB5518987.1 alpha-N-arabinofuranosidase [Amphiplicatus metriothermophilus]SNT74599.1 alpha-N-arabinofuranosidase [Amphiplicatus metriothermophilus]